VKFLFAISERQKLLETFTRKPDAFKHADLIKQMENITLIPSQQASNDAEMKLNDIL
jgi:hypothetical protein